MSAQCVGEDSPQTEDIFLHRQSVRSYQSRPVEKEKLLQLAEAVRVAPSASNGQPWKLIFVTESALKEKVAEATFSTLVSFNKFVPQAPVLAVLVIEKTKLITQVGGRMKKREFPLIDIGIAAEHLCLQATALGLGTCMLGWFDEKDKKIAQHSRSTESRPGYNRGVCSAEIPLAKENTERYRRRSML